MMGIKVIITGATGMVGEGVLLECLENPEIDEVLIISRKHYDYSHPKLKELLIKDFYDLRPVENQIKNYDACFFCAGISSIGIKEDEYKKITYDLTVSFARSLYTINPGMVFIYVSGRGTDSSENGKLMWARIKGKTENDLMKIPFKGVYNFRPAFMKPVKGQKNIKPVVKVLLKLTPVFKLIFPGSFNTLNEVGKAMINASSKGYGKNIIEVPDIRILAQLN